MTHLSKVSYQCYCDIRRSEGSGSGAFPRRRRGQRLGRPCSSRLGCWVRVKSTLKEITEKTHRRALDRRRSRDSGRSRASLQRAKTERASGCGELRLTENGKNQRRESTFCRQERGKEEASPALPAIHPSPRVGKEAGVARSFEGEPGKSKPKR